MDGYTEMVNELTQLLLGVISLYKEIWAAILPADLALALKYAYAGLTGTTGWIGYAIAALYYIGEDHGSETHSVKSQDTDTLSSKHSIRLLTLELLFQLHEQMINIKATFPTY
jgi:hypothetical protein